MPSPQIRRLTERHHYPVLSEATLDRFAREQESLVLFFSEDPLKFPESNDVAMVLPELIKAFAGRLQAALIEPNAQHRLQSRFGFNQWPALVFLRRGEYLGAITQIQNWEDYLREIDRLLQSDPVPAPSFPIPVVADNRPLTHQESSHE
jgi:hydrogenase-1 operon protein HyaE